MLLEPFSVSVGWLLGVEDSAQQGVPDLAAAQPDSTQESREEAQQEQP